MYGINPSNRRRRAQPGNREVHTTMRKINGGTKALLLLASVAALGALIGFMPAITRAWAQQAQQPGTWITEVDCDGSPELIVITNTSSEPQNLTSWKLESDPPDQESLDLTALAIIWPTQSIMIESGPQSEASFTWSRKQVFRNDDPTDYVRIVHKEGPVRQQVACAAPATATAAPTPPVLAATASPAAGGLVPDGGGRPGASSLEVISPTVAVAAGGAMVALSVTLLAAVCFAAFLGRRRRRAEAVEDRFAASVHVPEPAIEPAITVEPEPTVTITPSAVRRYDNSQRALLIALIVVLVTMALAVLVLQPRENGRR